MLHDLAGAALWVSGSLELSLLAKATLVLAVGSIATRFGSTVRASVRHLVAAASFIALAALPVLIASVPVIAIAVPVIDEPQGSLLQTAPGKFDEPAMSEAGAAVDQDVSTSLGQASPWTQSLRAVWAAGVVALLLPLASALWRLSRIRRTGLPASWAGVELARLATARGVSLPIELLEHEAVPGPMTFGISRPVIVLPIDARAWSDAELRCALRHELEHIQRRDWLMQFIARTVAAFYWFHPLVWPAWRRLCLEAERACDDAVVASEERTDYAAQLVMLAQRLSTTTARPVLGMANRSDLSTRVTAVLDDRLHRGRAGFAVAAGTVVAAALVVGSVASVSAIAKVEPVAIAVPEAASRPVADTRTGPSVDRALDNAGTAGDSARVKPPLPPGVKQSAKVPGQAVPPVPARNANNQTRRIFVLGEVRMPGRYAIEGEVTLLEVIAKAGSLTPSAGGDISVHRYKDPAAAGVTPAVPGDQRGAEVLRVTVDDVKEGRDSSRLLLQDGDTVFVAPAPRFYVVGYVRTPGAFALLPNMTVGDAIALAGGLAERGSETGIKIIRRVDGAEIEIDAAMDDAVKPNDTIRVRQRIL